MAHINGNGDEPHSDSDIISINKTEYDELLRVAQNHTNLKNALYSGGIDTQTLNILMGTNFTAIRKDSGFEAATKTEIEPRVERVKAAFSNSAPRRDYSAPTSKHEENALEGMRGGHSFDNSTQTGTLKITGISDLITYKDLTDVIRGGGIISITIHRRDHCAIVTMLDGAVDFLAHVKRHDLYVQSKRLEVEWGSRQFQLTQHVERQVLNGATRNLCLRNGARTLTEQDIRDDMEHIDKLVIIDVVFHGYDVFLYTNSVHDALFARTCMLSRKPYKSLRIEHFPDDCARPLPVHLAFRSQPIAQSPPHPYSKPSASNMYGVLEDDSDSISEESEKFKYRRQDDDDVTVDSSDDDGVSVQ